MSKMPVITNQFFNKQMKQIAAIILASVFCLLSISSCTAATQPEDQSPLTEAFYVGDVDGDGDVTAGDARLVLRASVGLEETDLQRMDADADGTVSAADARLVLRFAVGLESVLPVKNGSPEPHTGANVIVVYFSRTGHTKPLAEYAAEMLQTELYEIQAKIPYSDDDIKYYTDCRADREQKDPTARPEIAEPLSDLNGYDTVLLGYPIWHGQAPKIIYTFLEQSDLTGKTVVPFCTSASSPLGTSAENLHVLAPDAVWNDGRRFAIGTEKEEIAQWLKEIGLYQEEQEENSLRLTINGKKIDVLWEDNASVTALKTLAAAESLTVQLSPYGGFEQVGPLGKSIPSNDVDTTTEPGDIVLYSGNQIVLFYGSNTWSYTRLGKIQGMDQAALADLLGGDAVVLTFS